MADPNHVRAQPGRPGGSLDFSSLGDDYLKEERFRPADPQAKDVPVNSLAGLVQNKTKLM